MKIPHRILVLALEGFGILALLAFIAWIGLWPAWRKARSASIS